MCMYVYIYIYIYIYIYKEPARLLPAAARRARGDGRAVGHLP